MRHQLTPRNTRLSPDTVHVKDDLQVVSSETGDLAAARSHDHVEPGTGTRPHTSPPSRIEPVMVHKSLIADWEYQRFPQVVNEGTVAKGPLSPFFSVRQYTNWPIKKLMGQHLT